MRRKIDAALKAKIAWKRCESSGVLRTWPQRYEVHPNQISPGRISFRSRRPRAFDPGVGRDWLRTSRERR